MPTAVAAAYVTVRCSGCGEQRELTARQSRRPGRCELCRRLDRVSASKEELCWWLELLSDQALAEILTHASGREVSAVRVAALRVLLMARPARVLSSVSERAGLIEA